MRRKRLLMVLLLAVVCFAVVTLAWAGPGEGGNLPYEAWVCQK